MKLTKLACTALVAAVTFGTSLGMAKAVEVLGTTTDHLNLSFALKLSSQQPDTYTNNKTVWKFTTVKVTNKDILNMLAFLAQTTWPAGAQLEYIFDGYGYDQMVVADRTGTNILFYAGDGVDYEGLVGSFDFDPFDEDGVYQGTWVDATPGTYSYLEYYNGDFEFYIDDAFDGYANYMDLYGEGLTTETYSDNWTAKTDSGVDGIVMGPIGTGYYMDQEYNLLTGTVIGGEKWSGANKETVLARAKAHKAAPKH